MRNKLEQVVTSFTFQWEQRYGKYSSALLIALVLLIVAAIYVTPSIVAKELGRGYASLSINPFDFTEPNNLRCRILTPLLAYCLGLRGKLYILFPLLIAVFFLAATYIFLRKKLSATESMYATMLLSFSSPILFLLHFQGYVDVTSYLLILLIIIFIAKIFVWTPLLALLLLNHESNLFIIPALLFLYIISSGNKKNAAVYSIIATTTALLPFYFYRRFVSETSPVEYNFEMYLSQIKENIKTIAACSGAGIFYAFKLFWIFPAVAAYHYWKEKNRQQLLLFFFIISGALGQLLVASDTSRLLALAFPLILFSAIKLKEVYGTTLFTKYTFYLIIINFFIPQFYIGQSVMIPFYPLPVSLALNYCFGIII